MPHRRILSLWFPRLAAERMLRGEPGLSDTPFAVIGAAANAQHLTALNRAASAAGLKRHMGLADARALCPDLVTRAANPLRDREFLNALRRWAGRYSPWVAAEGDEALFLDITGCAHLFGDEPGLAADMDGVITGFGLSHRIGIADTAGAAWAMARYVDQGPSRGDRSGDAIDQEARATRSRAAKRRKWARLDIPITPMGDAPRIIPPGQTRRSIAPLPVAALRLPEDAVAGLARLGLGSIGDLAALPRGTIARRFGMVVTRRLDQALGAEPEPISPARAEAHFTMRLSFPDPIGLEADLLAGTDRLLAHLGPKLRRHGRGARRLRLVLNRADASWQAFEIGLAQPSDDPAHIAPLLALKLRDADAGFGIDMMRLEAHVTEPLNPHQHKGHVEAAAEARARMDPGGGGAFDTLLSRLGARVGLEAMTRLAPAESHIPEKTATIMAAAFSSPVAHWPRSATPRPLVMFPPEPVTVLEPGRPPELFRWRRRDFHKSHARGPERIAPEWWLDDPAWRSGPRDYWVIETCSGERLWLYEALGVDISGGWFCQGDFT